MRISEVTPGVHAVHGDSVNWVLVRENGALILIDAGYPGDAEMVLASIRAIGSDLDELHAILITHGHVDHMGGVPAILRQKPVPVFTGAAEVGNVRRERREQATPAAVAANLWRPGALPWMVEILGKGALRDEGVTSALALAEASAPAEQGDRCLDSVLPGAPVPVFSPGHTPGHTAYLLPRHRVLISGDALVTGHPVSRIHGPQLLPGFFHHDRSGLSGGLDRLAEVDADVLIPGHGPVFPGTPAEAVAQTVR